VRVERVEKHDGRVELSPAARRRKYGEP
jgi:hypothetical protein